MANYVLGKNGVAYVSATPVADATVATATTALTGGTIIANAKDVKSNLSTDKTDVTTRGGGGWKQTAPTLKDGTVTFTYQYKSGTDAVFSILLTAWVNGSEVFFCALDMATGAGAQGPAGNFTVTGMSRDETLTGSMIVDFELSASSSNSWFIHA
jgi:hypothetical protein